MTESVITLLILLVAAGIIAIYLLKFKPMKGSKVKDLYAEGLDMLVSGKRQTAYKNFKEIVDKDSNLDIAIPGIVFGAVGTAGQRCTSTRRIIAHESIFNNLKRF